ncbi:hypothetical protein J2X11_001206 [Aeromicrobium panaciterrae]|uniref:Secreted protein n=1 Tax=Aeromicrobium panaciterrae TaxID=363861 RepID=A0ABU1UMG5_9ACTN|nr:DUF5995 family protein [Aeromicrobium panaciterrae]MDR7086367.1 hypothetical protein [Aeromicrobium panaciterrae]
MSLPRRMLLAAVSIGLSLTALPANAGTLDPIIEILPPLPVPYHPTSATECADGSPTCIGVTIAQMEKRYDALRATCDHDAVFALAYLRVTENVRDALDEGIYDDPVWLRNQDAAFAQDYYDSYDNWHAGRKNLVPQAWRIAFQAADDGSVSALGNFMLSMNAHINRDFSYVLADAGLTGADGVSHKPDHNRFNARLDSLYHPVFSEEALELDPRFDDVNLANLDEEAVGAIMLGWRETVWRNAEALSLAKTPLALSIAKSNIETYATTQAVLYRSLFASSKARTAERNAYCHARQG